jgi:CheY-like chemotaxis protein
MFVRLPSVRGSGTSSAKDGIFDCVVLDLGLPDMTGFELIKQLKLEVGLNNLPIILYWQGSHELKKPNKRIAETIIVKDVRSPERLLDETASFLHRVQANLPPQATNT